MSIDMFSFRSHILHTTYIHKCVIIYTAYTACMCKAILHTHTPAHPRTHTETILTCSHLFALAVSTPFSSVMLGTPFRVSPLWQSQWRGHTCSGASRHVLMRCRWQPGRIWIPSSPWFFYSWDFDDFGLVQFWCILSHIISGCLG